MDNFATNPAKRAFIPNGVGLQSASSAKAWAAMSLLALSLSACGSWNDGSNETAAAGDQVEFADAHRTSSATGPVGDNTENGSGGSTSLVTASTASAGASVGNGSTASNSRSITTTSTGGTVVSPSIATTSTGGAVVSVGNTTTPTGSTTHTVTASQSGNVVDTSASVPGASCRAASAPGAIASTLVTPDHPVAVSKNFMGMHVSLNTPSYHANGYAPIPAPTYPYGYTRTLKVEVDGEEERGFWLNIEKSPGVYDWRYMDKWMAANAGHPVIWLIFGMPSFYAKYPGEPTRWPSYPGSASPPSNEGHEALKRYAQAAKARYGSQIAAFEVWNEPTLPWTGSATDYDERWSPSWGQANAPYNPTPFFSGSASDLANIAFTLNQANLGVPVLGAAFVDAWGTYSHAVTRFLNAPVTLPGGWGTGKNHIQALSVHYYDYSFSPADIVQAIDGYREKLRQAGVPNLPIWDTETGAEEGGRFSAYDYRAPISVQRWTLLGAAKGLESLVLYGHVSEDAITANLGNPIDNAEVAQSLREAAAIMGRTICNAAVLTDQRVWVTTADGKVFLK